MSKLVEIVTSISKKLEADKQTIADKKAELKTLETQEREITQELMDKTRTTTIEAAFEVLKKATEIELKLESTMEDILDSYSSRSFESFSELSNRARSLSDELRALFGEKEEGEEKAEVMVEMTDIETSDKGEVKVNSAKVEKGKKLMFEDDEDEL